jgi:hypothetical protein
MGHLSEAEAAFASPSPVQDLAAGTKKDYASIDAAFRRIGINPEADIGDSACWSNTLCLRERKLAKYSKLHASILQPTLTSTPSLELATSDVCDAAGHCKVHHGHLPVLLKKHKVSRPPICDSKRFPPLSRLFANLGLRLGS